MRLKATPPREAVADAVARLVDDRGRAWSGTPAELHVAIGIAATPDELADAAWPRSAVALSAGLFGLSDALRDRGLRLCRMPDDLLIEPVPVMLPGAATTRGRLARPPA